MILKNRKGVSLIVAIFMIVILGLIIVGLLTMVTTSHVSSAEELNSVQALFLAETGIEIFGVTGNQGSYSLNGNTIQIIKVKDIPVGFTTLHIIHSTGIVRGEIKRKIEAIIRD